ncbi:hypothetical protein QFC24_007105 [Naganishia onofrii]|uniref:Uncharacterized protein n=1 Tax=Naganishia onofrii TaxID=1851511 RepID=A0ACC2WUF9_9TREE|nr:hypothetical protein QFC24_007105 [Naganishia onofrii]
MSGNVHPSFPSYNQALTQDGKKTDVKAQLAALAARQSGGKTSDPAALSVPSAINARIPSVPDIDTSKKPAAGAGVGSSSKKGGKAKGKAVSAKQAKRAERAKERAEELGGQLEKKLREKEGRKEWSSSLNAARGEHQRKERGTIYRTLPYSAAVGRNRAFQGIELKCLLRGMSGGTYARSRHLFYRNEAQGLGPSYGARTTTSSLALA